MARTRMSFLYGMTLWLPLNSRIKRPGMFFPIAKTFHVDQTLSFLFLQIINIDITGTNWNRRRSSYFLGGRVLVPSYPASIVSQWIHHHLSSLFNLHANVFTFRLWRASCLLHAFRSNFQLGQALTDWELDIRCKYILL